MLCNDFVADLHSDHSFEVGSSVEFVWDFSLVTILFPFRWPPAFSIDGGDDAMDPIRGQEPVFYPLTQAVHVNRISEISVGDLVLFAKRSRGHSQLECWFEVFEYLPPIVFIHRASAMAFIHNNEVKKVRRVLLEQTRSSFIFRDGLVCCEVNLSTLSCISLYFPTGITKRGEYLILRVVYEDVAVC